jgi:hypothetical protein
VWCSKYGFHKLLVDKIIVIQKQNRDVEKSYCNVKVQLLDRVKTCHDSPFALYNLLLLARLFLTASRFISDISGTRPNVVSDGENERVDKLSSRYFCCVKPLPCQFLGQSNGQFGV